MSNSLLDPSTRQMPAPPYEEIRQQRRKGTIMITVLAGGLGAVLIAGALFGTGLAGINGSQPSTAGTTESTVAGSSRPMRRSPKGRVAEPCSTAMAG